MFRLLRCVFILKADKTLPGQLTRWLHEEHTLAESELSRHRPRNYATNVKMRFEGSLLRNQQHRRYDR